MNDSSNKEVVVTAVTAKYINIAVSEFEKKLDVQWDNYKVIVTDAEDVVMVCFHSIKSTQGLRGAVDGVPGFEVTINKSDSLVLQSGFVR